MFETTFLFNTLLQFTEQRFSIFEKTEINTNYTYIMTVEF